MTRTGSSFSSLASNSYTSMAVTSSILSRLGSPTTDSIVLTILSPGGLVWLEYSGMKGKRLIILA